MTAMSGAPRVYRLTALFPILDMPPDEVVTDADAVDYAAAQLDRILGARRASVLVGDVAGASLVPGGMAVAVTTFTVGPREDPDVVGGGILALAGCMGYWELVHTR
ncbi:hypothetical protein [Nocardioides ochotonae]|uniref:hypothetical protein n=1 Tax=Nocardioides ochotonae TaxID=2685869 RepID=UPI001749F1D3|nr:hypothetical protein [Nocardioides ochotonae]